MYEVKKNGSFHLDKSDRRGHQTERSISAVQTPAVINSCFKKDSVNLFSSFFFLQSTFTWQVAS